MCIRTIIYLLLMLPLTAAAACGPYTVAFYDMGQLYSRQPDGSWQGADKDVIDELARRTGCRFHGKVESRVRIWAMIKAGQLDITVSGVATPERLAQATFIPYMGGRNLVLLSKEVDPRIRTAAQFLDHPRYTVAVVKSFQHGPTYDAWLAQLRAQGRVYDAADVTAMIRLLELGRVHAVIASNMQPQVTGGAWRAMDWAPQDNIVSGLVLAKGRVRAADVERFASALQAMRADGTLEAIYARHMDRATVAILMQY